MEIKELHKAFINSTGVCIDTRSLANNNIFFALKGGNFNGNKFASQALEQGAIAAVIDEPDFLTDGCILVHDVLESLQKLSKYHREQLSIPVIGLTGSNGKTTTKELMYAALSSKYNTIATKGNLNNHIGVPLTLLSITDEHEMAIVEMGANHQKEIEFLCSLSQPDFGYITNFGKAHLEGFGGVDGVIKGKSELYDYLKASRKKAIVNLDDPIQIEKTSDIQSMSFGADSHIGDYNFEHTTKETSYLSLAYQGVSIFTQLTGDYNFSNLSAALSLALHFGINIQDLKIAIEAYSPSNNRSQVNKTDKNTLVIDAYNANPSSMEAAILNFQKFEGESKWLILGDMFELGEYEALEHQQLVDNLAQLDYSEKVCLVGKAFSKTNAQFDKFDTTEELLDFIEKESPENKTILIKGSRGMKLEKVIPLL